MASSTTLYHMAARPVILETSNPPLFVCACVFMEYSLVSKSEGLLKYFVDIAALE